MSRHRAPAPLAPTALVSALTAGTLLLAACGSLPATRYYTLAPPRPAAQTGVSMAAGEGLVVAVESFLVDPPYDQDQIVYRVGEGSPEVGFYAYHRWAAPLGRLLAVAAAEELAGVPGLESIAPAAAVGEPEAFLDGRLFHLEEIDTAEGQIARVRLHLALRRAGGEVIWEQTVAAEERGSAETVLDVVEQMRRGLARAFAEAREGLAGALAEGAQ